MQWTEGYVTGLNYTRNCYRELGASHQAFVLAANGFEAPDLQQPFTKVELGCGYGFSLLLEASVFPQSQFYGVDFNPDHITWAKRVAEKAGLGNVHFIEMSFADLMASNIPDIDFLGMHGVWSWVDQENRDIISRFLERRMKSGGLVMVSYNVLPGQSANNALREIMLRKFWSSSGTTHDRIQASLDFANEFVLCNAPILAQYPGIASHLRSITGLPSRYLAHEYFNQNWTPFHHYTVVKDMAESRLSYVASAKVLENSEVLNFQPSTIKLFDKVAQTERETLKDIYLNRMFRYDIYGRGLEQIGLFGSVGHILQSRFVLVNNPAEFTGQIKTPAGPMNFKKELYEPILTRLKQGPALGQEFVMQPGPRPLSPADVTQMLSILLDENIVYPAMPADGYQARAERTKRINMVLMDRMLKGEDTSFLISPVSGFPHHVADFAQHFIAAQAMGKNPITYAWKMLKAHNKRMSKDGKVLMAEDENIKELEDRFQDFERDFKPTWSRLEIIA